MVVTKMYNSRACELSYSFRNDHGLDMMLMQCFPSMQLNIGVIAASIPTMKPLLKTGAATLYGDRNTPYRNYERSNDLNGPKACMPRRSFLALEDTRTIDESYEMSTRLTATSSSRVDNFDSTYRDRVGSEECILETANTNAKRIMRTTEVVINNAERDTCA